MQDDSDVPAMGDAEAPSAWINFGFGFGMGVSFGSGDEYGGGTGDGNYESPIFRGDGYGYGYGYGYDMVQSTYYKATYASPVFRKAWGGDVFYGPNIEGDGCGYGYGWSATADGSGSSVHSNDLLYTHPFLSEILQTEKLKALNASPMYPQGRTATTFRQRDPALQYSRKHSWGAGGR